MVEEKKIPTIRKDNIFHIHRKEIGDISEKEKCEVGTAASKLAHEKGWGEEATADRAEFDLYVAHLFRTNSVSDNRVVRYFDGE